MLAMSVSNEHEGLHTCWGASIICSQKDLHKMAWLDTMFHAITGKGDPGFTIPDETFQIKHEEVSQPWWVMHGLQRHYLSKDCRLEDSSTKLIWAKAYLDTRSVAPCKERGRWGPFYRLRVNFAAQGCCKTLGPVQFLACCHDHEVHNFVSLEVCLPQMLALCRWAWWPWQTTTSPTQLQRSSTSRSTPYTGWMASAWCLAR